MTRLLLLLCWLLVSPGVWATSSRDFDETTDCIEFNNALDPAGGDATFAGWTSGDVTGVDFARLITNFNSATTPDVGYVIVKRSGANREKITCAVMMGDTLRGPADSTTTFSDAVWKFVLCDFTDGVSASINLFIDNMATAETATSGNFGTFNGGASEFVAGAEASTITACDTREWDGRIAHVQVIDRVVTEAERTQMQWLPGSIPMNLYSPMMGTDSPEIDLSANDYSGTVTGAVDSASGPPVSMGGMLPL